MSKIDWPLLFQITLVAIFLALFCVTATIMIVQADPSKFIESTFSALWAVFLSAANFDSLKKLLQKKLES